MIALNAKHAWINSSVVSTIEICSKIHLFPMPRNLLVCYITHS